jgi:hypothetical protein
MEQPDQKTSADRLAPVLRWITAIIVTVIVLGGSFVAYAYFSTPDPLRRPVQAHYHFRLQVVNGGQIVNFADAKYQTAFNDDNCSALITKEPIHFHDNLSQFVHIHWAHMTGGILLKNYGWNLIGGTDTILGYRFDALPKLTSTPIHGRALPTPPKGAHYFVYESSMANPGSYHQKVWADFLQQDLRTFMGAGPAPKSASTSDTADEKLAQLNDVIATQIQARFDDLIPLPNSVCGG